MNVEEVLRNFLKALEKLDKFISEPVLTERDRAGVIQAFEFTFEQFWKCCQKIAAFERIEARSPKQSLEAALSLGIIDVADEDKWLNMLEDRNLMSHTYNEAIAQEVVFRITSHYQQLFHKALSAIRSQWAAP